MDCICEIYTLELIFLQTMNLGMCIFKDNNCMWFRTWSCLIANTKQSNRNAFSLFQPTVFLKQQQLLSKRS